MKQWHMTSVCVQGRPTVDAYVTSSAVNVIFVGDLTFLTYVGAYIGQH